MDRLAEVDVGLLLAFEAMGRERNVSRAAARLGITQSALSSRLARLRLLFDDRLFVPMAGRGMVPTPRADALGAELDRLLSLLRDFVGPADAFDPRTSDRVFVVAAYDSPTAMFAPDLIPILKRDAPNVRVAFVLPDAADAAAALERGNVDLFIGVPRVRQPELLSRSLGAEAFATAQRRDHPRGTGPLTLDAFCACEHLLISVEGGQFSGVVDAAIDRLGRTRRVGLSVQSYALAPLMLASTDCLCTLPRRFLRRFTSTLDLFEPPLALDRLELTAVWHPRMKDDAAHRWLRSRVFAAAGTAD